MKIGWREHTGMGTICFDDELPEATPADDADAFPIPAVID